jgi:hypothetical protein
MLELAHPRPISRDAPQAGAPRRAHDQVRPVPAGSRLYLRDRGPSVRRLAYLDQWLSSSVPGVPAVPASGKKIPEISRPFACCGRPVAEADLPSDLTPLPPVYATGRHFDQVCGRGEAFAHVKAAARRQGDRQSAP